VSSGIDPLALVVAKLRRVPQDRFQAAVVLEAWAGKKAPDSFGVSPDPLQGGPVRPSRSSRLATTAPSARLSDFAALFTIVITAVLWVPQLRGELGLGLDTSIALGLPSALALDGAIRIRYLAAGNTRSLRPDLYVVNAVLALVLVLVASSSPTLALALAVVVLWGQAGILSVRRLLPAYFGLVAVTTGSMWLLPWDVIVVVAAALVMLAATTAAVATDHGDASLPETLPATLAVAVVGASNGIMLVAEPGVWRSATPATTAAVLLVTVTGWVASVRMTRLWVELPARLADADLDPGSRGVGGWIVARAMIGASVRIIVPTIIALLIYARLHAAEGMLVVCAFTGFALATLTLSLNIATRQWGPVAAIAAGGAAVTLLVEAAAPGLSLLCGAAFVIVASGLVAKRTFNHAAVAFVTRMMMR
jgi:hypothetical protein